MGAGIPIRIPVAAYRPGSGQQKVHRRNSHALVQIFTRFAHCPDAAAHDAIARAWMVARHGHYEQDCSSLAGMATPFIAISDARGPLAGMFYKATPDTFEARLFYYDVTRAQSSPGTFAIMTLIAHARREGRDYVHLGTWESAPQARTAYKINFRPCEVFRNGRWETYTPYG